MGFRGKLGHDTASLRHVCKHIEVVPAMQNPHKEDNSANSFNCRFSNRDGYEEAKLTDCSSNLNYDCACPKQVKTILI